MQSSFKYYLLALLVCTGLGYAFGRYHQPAQQDSKVTDSIKKETETTDVIIKRPDGTIETSHSVTVINEHDKSKQVITSNEKPQYKVSALMGFDYDNSKRVYGAAIERRIVGPVSAGLWGTTNKEIGVSLSVEF